jgi:hypothetical protein
MHATADSISQLTQSKQINIGQQEECLFSVQRLTSIDLFSIAVIIINHEEQELVYREKAFPTSPSRG